MRRWRQRHKPEGGCPWYAAHREQCIARAQLQAVDNPMTVRGYKRKSHLKKVYGLTVEQYEAMYTAQNGCCAICGAAAAMQLYEKLCVDHCHATGVVRGLLCKKCNTLIGMAEDQGWVLEAAIAYLQC